MRFEDSLLGKKARKSESNSDYNSGSFLIQIICLEREPENVIYNLFSLQWRQYIEGKQEKDSLTYFSIKW